VTRADPTRVATPEIEAFVAREEPGMGTVEIFALPTDEPTLLAIIHTVFDRYWSRVHFGTLIQGAVFEIAAQAPPRIGVLDGYVTVDLGASHFHVCIGEHRGSPDRPVDPALARHRRCHRAELYRTLHEGDPVSWGMRLFNGADEQQLTVMLPNPFLDDRQQLLAAPDWDRLECWDELRASYLGLGPDPRDRRAIRFHHG
jgi:hypothetical protein